MESTVEETWLCSYPSSATKQMFDPRPIMCPLWAWFPCLWDEKNQARSPHVPLLLKLCASSSTSEILHHRLLILNPSSHSSFWGPFQHLRKINLPLSFPWYMVDDMREVSGSQIHMYQTCDFWRKKHDSKNPILLTLPLIQSALHERPQKNLSASSFSFYQTDITLIYSSNIYWIPPK